ncbi:hypothetical protein AMECASPLE_027345 [Ameca splendens]|uniref:Uncharacterized protein n=1 Tax=Ameca splendens TaxID=208324 RepID=A0ABV0ZSS5_9TELE
MLKGLSQRSNGRCLHPNSAICFSWHRARLLQTLSTRSHKHTKNQSRSQMRRNTGKKLQGIFTHTYI